MLESIVGAELVIVVFDVGHAIGEDGRPCMSVVWSTERFAKVGHVAFQSQKRIESQGNAKGGRSHMFFWGGLGQHNHQP
jgi:hypothetical protein